jgi:4-aminobutyrate aminotransferase-like enzyme
MLLRRGILILPSGSHGQVLAFSPPFVVTPDEIDAMLGELEACLSECIGA